MFKAVEQDGRAGSTDDLIEEERTPAADETKVQDIEEEGGHERTQEGDGEERVASHLCSFARSAQDACGEDRVRFREAHDCDEDHDDRGDLQRGGIIRVQCENVRSEEEDRRAYDGREDETPLDAASLVAVPVLLTALAAGLPRHDHARLAEAHDEVIVDVTDVHADAVYCEGDRAESCRHAAEEHHAHALTALLRKDAEKDRHDAMEIRTVGKVASAVEERFAFQNPRSPSEREDRTRQCTDGRARHAEGGDRAEAENQQCIQREVHHIAADIRLHNDARASIAQLHRLQDERERGHVHRGERDGAIRHGFCHVLIIRAHEVEDVIQENIEKDVQKSHEDRAERE